MTTQNRRGFIKVTLKQSILPQLFSPTLFAAIHLYTHLSALTSRVITRTKARALTRAQHGLLLFIIRARARLWLRDSAAMVEKYKIEVI
jgi:hypothetical protein